MTEFRNESGLEFTDISSEECRIYTYPDGAKLNVEGPLKLHVSASGGHRIFTDIGTSMYIQPGWVCVEWITKDGRPHFVK